MLRALTILISCLLAFSASAQSSHDAIGRIDLGSDGFCTGTLVAPDLVLTAAHCLFDKTTGVAFDVTQLTYQVGLSNGRAKDQRAVSRTLMHSRYQPQAKGQLGNMQHDLALLKLAEPVADHLATPMRLGHPDLSGAQAELISYGKGRSDTALLETGCNLQAHTRGIIVTSCQAALGTSGAPVLQLISGEMRLVSVVSAKARANGEPVALTVIAGTEIPKMMTQLSAFQLAAYAH